MAVHGRSDSKKSRFYYCHKYFWHFWHFWQLAFTMRAFLSLSPADHKSHEGAHDH